MAYPVVNGEAIHANGAITSFTLAVPQADLEDLNRRIDQTRWPDAENIEIAYKPWLY